MMSIKILKELNNFNKHTLNLVNNVWLGGGHLYSLTIARTRTKALCRLTWACYGRANESKKWRVHSLPQLEPHWPRMCRPAFSWGPSLPIPPAPHPPRSLHPERIIKVFHILINFHVPLAHRRFDQSSPGNAIHVLLSCLLLSWRFLNTPLKRSPSSHPAAVFPSPMNSTRPERRRRRKSGRKELSLVR